jgi:hypothetical protein
MNMEPRNLRNSEMTEQEYDIERAKLRETYGSGIGKLAPVEARAKSDIALCRFLVSTGWPNDRLAKKEVHVADFSSRSRDQLSRRFL